MDNYHSPSSNDKYRGQLQQQEGFHDLSLLSLPVIMVSFFVTLLLLLMAAAILVIYPYISHLNFNGQQCTPFHPSNNN
jgi:hypothetical protein